MARLFETHGWRRWLGFSLALAVGAGTADVRAQTLPDDCLAKPTLPLPTCVPAVDARERAQVTLQRARAWVQKERWQEVIATLEPQLAAFEGSEDMGSLVRAHTELGRAHLALADIDAGTQALTTASTLWASERSLRWIRSLPSGELSQRAVQLASDAATGAVVQLAELWLRRNDSPLPAFAGRDAPLPFAPKPDAALRPAQRQLREQWVSRQRSAFIRYVHEQVEPWLLRQRRVLQQAQREFQRAYLVPPAASAAWRVAVAAHVGQIWWDFAALARSNQCGAACWDLFVQYGSLGTPFEAEERLARSAFEECADLSSRFRLLTPSALVCERWLADNTYRSTHHRMDELMPTADWRPRLP